MTTKIILEADFTNDHMTVKEFVEKSIELRTIAIKTFNGELTDIKIRNEV